MSNLEQAILTLYDPSLPQHLKQQALQLTETTKADPAFYQYALQMVLDINLDHPNALTLIFWYLQAIEDMFRKGYSTYDQSSRQAIHRFFVMVIDNKPSLLEIHFSILNKFALLYVRAVQNDFPYVWPDAFTILIDRASQRETYMKLFFTVLKLFNEEFAEELGYLTQEQLRRSNELKDAMRERVLSSAANLWLQTLNMENIQLISATFQVIAPYID